MPPFISERQEAEVPNIREFTNPDVNLNKPEIGIEATAQSARHIGAYYHQIGAEAGSAIRETGDMAVRYMDHQQISAGAAGYSTLFDQKTQEWNDLAKNADPNDPTVAQKFREENLEPAFEEFRKQFSTERSQQWAEGRIESLRNHFTQKTSADMSTLAGHALDVNITQMATRLSNSVYRDPTGLNAALEAVDSAGAEMIKTSPNLKAEHASKVQEEVIEKIKKQIVQSAAVGAVRTNPDAGLKLAQDPTYAKYISGREMDQLTKEAQSVDRNNRAWSKYEDQQKKQDQQRASDDAVVDIRARLDNGQRIPRDAIWNNDTLTRHDKEHLVTIMDQRARGAAAQDDPQTKQGFIDRFIDPTTTQPTKSEILRAEAEERLSTKTGSILRQWVDADERGITRDKVFKDTLHGARQLIGTDPVGAGRYASFLEDFLPKYQTLKREGKLPDNALNLRDPESLISKSMQQYQRPPAQIMIDHQMRGESINLTAPGTTITGTQTTNIPAVPDTLRTNPNIAWSPSKGRWYDQSTRKAYDTNGKPL